MLRRVWLAAAGREEGREACWPRSLGRWVVRPRALLIGFEEADLAEREEGRGKERTLMTYFTAAAAAASLALALWLFDRSSHY